MPQWFFRFPEFSEFSEFNENSAPFRENSNKPLISLLEGPRRKPLTKNVTVILKCSILQQYVKRINKQVIDKYMVIVCKNMHTCTEQYVINKYFEHYVDMWSVHETEQFVGRMINTQTIIGHNEKPSEISII